jgi:hypothetical protein
MALNPIIVLQRRCVLSQKQQQQAEHLHPLGRRDRTEVCLFYDAVNCQIYTGLVVKELSMDTQHYWNDSDMESRSTLRNLPKFHRVQQTICELAWFRIRASVSRGWQLIL